MNRFVLLLLAPLAACIQPDTTGRIVYNLSNLPVSAVGTHYEHFVEIDGAAVASLGCFVVEEKQKHCQDAQVSPTTGEVTPIIRKVIVSCECPCTEKVANPCEESVDQKPMVIAGSNVGILEMPEPPLSLGGAEFETTLDVSNVTEVFISREPDSDTDPVPTLPLVLRGDVVRDGEVLRGSLFNPTGITLLKGNVGILPITDGASL